MADLLSPLTHDGQRVITNAKRIAKQYDQPVIDSEMLLLGLLQLSGSQAEAVFKTLHTNLENMTARLAASIKLQARQEEQPQVEAAYSKGNTKLSANTTTILNEALSEAEQHGLDFVDTRLLVLGILRCPNSKAGQFLNQYGVTLDQFRAEANLQETPVTNLPRFTMPALTPDSVFFGISPVFVGLVLFTVFSAYVTYIDIGNSEAAMFFFVTGGWIVSVALHEFGHALVAYWGGDDSVVDKGYLTLNPLKYTHPFLSIFLPVLFLLIGGIGLPGGAVYINPMAIKSAAMRSLGSAGGPIATVLCAALLALPFIFGWYNYATVFDHLEFWAGLGFLAFLQITALFINLLPIPTLDGFGIAEPFLPPEMAQKMNTIRPFGFLILYGLLLIDTPVRDLFWGEVWNMVVWVNPDMAWFANEGLQMYHFWQ